MAALTGIISAVGTAATAYSSIKSAEVAEKGQREQAKMLKQQQEDQAAEIKKAQAESLAKRKQQIDTQRKQILGAGDTAYSINQTSSAGADSASGSLIGATLG